jgi:hypothetical protein
MAGTLKEPALYILMGPINGKGHASNFGYTIRVSQVFPDWNRQESDYIYFYVYDEKKTKVTVTRCAVDQFQCGFSWECNGMVGLYEEKANEQLN